MRTMPVRFDMNGLKREHRVLYRTLRKVGFTRAEANLVVFGAVLESGAADEISLSAEGWKLTYSDPFRQRGAA